MEVKDASVQLRLDRNTGDYVPYSCWKVCGFFNVPYYLISNKGYETGPPVYSDKTLSVGPAGVELTTSRMTARCSTNWATGAPDIFDDVEIIGEN